MTSSGKARKVQNLVLVLTRILTQVTHLHQAATLHLIRATLNPARKVKTQSSKAIKARVSRSPNHCISARFPTSTPNETKVMKFWCIHLGAKATLKTPMIRLSWKKVVRKRQEGLHLLSKKSQAKSRHNQKRRNESQFLTRNQLKAKAPWNDRESLKKQRKPN